MHVIKTLKKKIFSSFFNNKYSNRVNQFDNLLNEIRTIIEK